VQSITVQATTEPVFFETSGTVIPARKLVVRTEVAGRIVEQNTNLVPGGIINKDDLLIRLDSRDYRFQVRQQQAELVTAKYERAVEQGKQTIAHQEWQIMAREMGTDTANKDLALRKPHLRHAKARIAAAQAGLEAAELAVERATLRAPWDGIVLEEEVEQGQYLGKQSAVATLVGRDAFWVQVGVPVFLVERLEFPVSSDDTGQGSSVEIILDRGQNAHPVIRQGTVYKLLADLDTKGRMARVLVRLPDPLCLQAGETNVTCGPEDTILLGSFVQVRIKAGQLEQVFVLPEKALRAGNRLWLVNGQGVLAVREARVLWRRVNEVLVDAEIGPDERVITSHLQSPVPGMQVREE
jgi:RND family efflux transporter MFP subunit